MNLTTPMTIDQWGVVLVLAVALGFLVRRAVRTVRGAQASTGGCDHCAQGGGRSPVPPAARRVPTTPPQ
jgi:hypothetical protein